MVASGTALAGENSIGLKIISDRSPDDFAVPGTTKYEVSVSHAFDNGTTLGLSAEVSDSAFSSSFSGNLQATAGYRLRFNSAFSVSATAGLGERIQAVSDGGSFPYYVLYLATDVAVTEDLTWNISYRYRDAFDPADDYNTPQIATGLTFKLDDHNSVASHLSQSWREGKPNGIGLSLGIKHAF